MIGAQSETVRYRRGPLSKPRPPRVNSGYFSTRLGDVRAFDLEPGDEPGRMRHQDGARPTAHCQAPVHEAAKTKGYHALALTVVAWVAMGE